MYFGWASGRQVFSAGTSVCWDSLHLLLLLLLLCLGLLLLLLLLSLKSLTLVHGMDEIHWMHLRERHWIICRVRRRNHPTHVGHGSHK